MPSLSGFQGFFEEYIPRLIAYQLKYEELIKNSANRIEFEAVKNEEGRND